VLLGALMPPLAVGRPALSGQLLNG
jgi:hypothetical protein